MSEKKSQTRENVTGGLILVGVGLVALLSQFINLGDWGVFLVAGLGLVFLLVGVAQREVGYLIPGGILSGIGTGIVLIAGPWQTQFRNIDEGAVFMFAFAGGWVVITLLSALFARETAWWALIPGAIMALVGFTVLYGGAFATALTWVGRGWPVLLIIAGLYALLRPEKTQELLQD
jgi:hypothetical protein